MTFDPHGQRYSNSIDVGEEYDRALAEAETRADRAEVALAKYARHLDTCNAVIGPNHCTCGEVRGPGADHFRNCPLFTDTCTCGLRRALEKP